MARAIMCDGCGGVAKLPTGNTFLGRFPHEEDPPPGWVQFWAKEHRDTEPGTNADIELGGHFCGWDCIGRNVEQLRSLIPQKETV